LSREPWKIAWDPETIKVNLHAKNQEKMKKISRASAVPSEVMVQVFLKQLDKI
jgi:hypothetical protein